ncbi:adenomatous polyposis coli homolog isoform X2 [Antennarius striatus]|uniref:adenomatous polyposis coli homolog isoform X2 n=1 Tax=Antennarius striatus TaxID=241820 RepID=UPI0035B41171
MATVQCSKCTAERKGFRRELDSWRHKLIHCVGFESILEGIYGQMLLRDISLFDDCEPEEVDDWSPSASCSHCSFCNLPLDKLSDRGPAATSPLSSPSDYSPCQAPTVCDSSQSAHRFLQAVFHKKDVPLGCDSNIPLVAQELMKKMINQFALEYASKCLHHTNTNGVTTMTSSPVSDTSDAPLDLTVHRNQEEKESEDGVLDLSNRNSACSVTSSSSSDKASGSLPPSLTEDLEDLGQREKKRHRSSVLDAVLGSLCPSHSSLLYQMLKLAHQEELLFHNHRPVGQMESHCCHCGVNSQETVTPNAVPFGEYKATNGGLYYPITDCDHGSTVCHPGDCQANIHHYPLTNCKSEANRGSNYCCLQRSRMETYSVLCPKRLHYISCQSLAVGCINNVVCSNSSLFTPASLCPSSLTCCNQHNLHSCPCYSNHACMTQLSKTIESVVGDRDPPFPVLKREQSPSPPPLSPIPTDINKKTNEKPPSLLHHRQEEEADLKVKDDLVNVNQQETDMDATTEERQECKTPNSHCAGQNPSGTLLQDVMNRFSEKLDTIRPLEKDPPLVSTTVDISEKEPLQSPSTSHKFHADAHLTEIITTVLHTRSASDYNLSELFNRHESNEPKSPNTRFRRRQEVLAAMATPANDVSARRHTLQIKRELAMLDQSHSKRKSPPAKRARLKVETRSNTSLESQSEVQVEPVENHRVREEPANSLATEHGQNEIKEEMQTFIVTGTSQFIKAEVKEKLIANEVKCLSLSDRQVPVLESQRKHSKQDSLADSVQDHEMIATATPAKQCNRTCNDGTSNSAQSRGENTLAKRKDYPCPLREKQKCPSQHSEETRRSRRNIVPPHRFSSYVTEPRKMFFVACFSENIFKQKTQEEEEEEALSSNNVDTIAQNPPKKETRETIESSGEIRASLSEHLDCGLLPHDESKSLLTNKEFSLNVIVKEDSPKNYCPDNGTDAKPFGRIRSSRKSDLKTTSTALTSQSTTDSKSITCAVSPHDSQVLYTSPIKLMFVSQVKDKEGVRYSLKSAGTGSSGEAEEPFDPCEESSWSGTMKYEKGSIHSFASKVQSSSSPLKSATSPTKSACSSPKSASSLPKSVSTPPKSASLSPKSVSSPTKSASSPPKSASSPRKSSPTKTVSSLKSSSSSPKISPRRSPEGTPSKRPAGTENQRSPGGSPSFHETTPPKRRPGRPKKLGPQLEQKVKRPIGRPRKQKAVDSVIGADTGKGKSDIQSDVQEKGNNNLKITVMYGRSRRNKRTVSEGCDQLQTEFHHSWQAGGLKSGLGILMHNSSSGNVKKTSEECAPQPCSSIKCQKQDGTVPSRKPGRPAKVKVSGISVTVSVMSPQQRKIQINKDTRQTNEALIHKKALSPEFKSAKEPWTINHHSTGKISRSEEKINAKDEIRDKLPNKPVAVRHSMRVRKPSIHFLYAVATSTSRSYSHSNALLRRSKQLLLNKASNQMRQMEQRNSAETSGEKRQLCGGKERKNIPQDLCRVEGQSVDSIFSPKETLKWWAASAEKKTLNLELARRIRLISDTWVSDTVEKQGKESAFSSKLSARGSRKSKHSSVVRTLFDCSPNKPRSCSMQQLCSWFMQTTETQSLAIVKKASSRNPYEIMHFPRSVNKKSVCHSPQAERLRKHMKKFAKIVPKTPSQNHQAQKRLRKRNDGSRLTNIRRQLFTPKMTTGRCDREVQCRRREFVKYQATLFRARTRFLNQKQRESLQKRQRKKKNKTNTPIMRLKPDCKVLLKSGKYQLSDGFEDRFATSSVDQTQEPTDGPKEQNICSKAWSPETLKECRVFLRKINSPQSESTEEEWDSCTVTLDDGSPSTYVFSSREKGLVEVVKAVKTKRKGSKNRTASNELASSAPKSVQDRHATPMGRQKRKYKSPGVLSTEPPQPLPEKMLRQSRMRGLTGPRWCDFVFET